MSVKKQVKFNIQTANCGVCEVRSGIFSNAAAYCKTCMKFLCDDCIKPHRKLVAMDNHAVLRRDHEIKEETGQAENSPNPHGNILTKVPEEIENTFEEYKEYRNRTMKEIERTREDSADTVNEMNTFKRVENIDNSNERCEYHPKLEITHYCTLHEELCCVSCKSLNHNACLIYVKYIPEELQREKKSNTVYAFKRLISDFKEFDTCLQSDMKELKKSKQTFLFDLKAKKRELINWINLMEVRAIRRLEIVVDKCKREIEKKRKSTKKSCQELRSEMFFLKDILENENNDEIYKFIKEKRAFRTLKDIEAKREHRQFTKSRFCLKLNPDFESLKGPMDHLYEIRFEAKGEDKFSVRLKQDIRISNVTGCTFIDSGDAVLADRSNGKLKHLDMTFKTVRHIVVPSDIFDVTAIGHNSVAFTSPLKSAICITELRPTLQIMKTINTGDGSCWGISHYNGLFAINVTSKDSCFIKIIDMDSNELLKVDIKRQFYSLIKLDSDHDNHVLHVITTAAYEEGKSKALEHFIDVHDKDISGHKVKISVYNYLNHLKTKGIEYNKHGNLAVCCNDTNQVYTMSKSGDEVELLLAEIDGLYKPQSLCYNKDRTKLLVTSECTDFIQIFRL